MKRFVFPPQVALNLQARKVERLQGELAEALKNMMKAEEELQWACGEYDQVIGQLNGGRQQGIKAGDLQAYWLCLERLKDEIENKRQALQWKEKIYKQKQQELAEALKYQKALERLKEIRYMEYQDEIRDQENRWLDEVAIGGFVRK